MEEMNSHSQRQHDEAQVRTIENTSTVRNTPVQDTDLSIQAHVRKRQLSGRRFGALMLRLTEEQKELLKYVSQQKRISMQELVEVPIMELYEEQYGLAFDEHLKSSFSGVNITRYTYKVSWSEDEQQYVATVAEFPSLSWPAPDSRSAYIGILDAVGKLVDEMEAEGKDLPTPLGERDFPSTIKISPTVHRDLVVEAWRLGVPVGSLINDKLAAN